MSDGADRLWEPGAALLLGGASRRMGRDKAQLPFRGTTLGAWLARRLAFHFAEVLLVGGDPPAEAPGRAVADPPGPQCALTGLRGALEASERERVLVLATDLPHVTDALLLGLVAYPQADVVVPRDAHGRHPLCALYRREPALAAVRTQLESGDLRVQGALDRLDVRDLAGEDLLRLDPEGRALTNANTPEEWEEVLGGGA